MDTKIDSSLHAPTTEGPFVITDEVDGTRFYADFRDHKDATLTPFDRVNGCMWSLSAKNATVFVSKEEALRALQARSYFSTKRLKVIVAPVESLSPFPTETASLPAAETAP